MSPEVGVRTGMNTPCDIRVYARFEFVMQNGSSNYIDLNFEIKKGNRYCTNIVNLSDRVPQFGYIKSSQVTQTTPEGKYKDPQTGEEYIITY